MPETLQNLRSTDFSAHIGSPCLLEHDDIVIETVVDAVTENPKARHPRAAPESRTPFSLFLRGAPDCPWEGGTFTLRIEGMPEIPGVFASRILNDGPEPASLFQAVFN